MHTFLLSKQIKIINAQDSMGLMMTGTILYGTNCIIKSKSVDAWNLVNDQLYCEKLQEKK